MGCPVPVLEAFILKSSLANGRGRVQAASLHAVMVGPTICGQVLITAVPGAVTAEGDPAFPVGAADGSIIALGALVSTSARYINSLAVGNNATAV